MSKSFRGFTALDGVHLDCGSNGKVLWLVERRLVGGAVGFGYSHSLQKLASQDTCISAPHTHTHNNTGYIIVEDCGLIEITSVVAQIWS